MTRVNLDAVPGVRSVRRIRRTVHSEIAENKYRLDHLGRDTAVLLEALTSLRSELAALAFTVEDVKRRIDDSGQPGDGSIGGRLQRMDDTLQTFGEQLKEAIEGHDRQSLGRLTAVRAELVSLAQSWDWSEDRPPDGSSVADRLCAYLAPLLHGDTAIAFGSQSAAAAESLRDRGLDVIAVARPPAAAGGPGTTATVDELRIERGWDEDLGIVWLAADQEPSELLGGFGSTRCEVLLMDLRGDVGSLAPLRESAGRIGLRRWLVLIHRAEVLTFDVSPARVPACTSATSVFVRDRDTFLAAIDWCSRNVAREPSGR